MMQNSTYRDFFKMDRKALANSMNISSFLKLGTSVIEENGQEVVQVREYPIIAFISNFNQNLFLRF